MNRLLAAGFVAIALISALAGVAYYNAAHQRHAPSVASVDGTADSENAAQARAERPDIGFLSPSEYDTDTAP